MNKCTHKELFENKKALSNHIRWCEGKLLKQEANKCPDCSIEIHPQAKYCGTHAHLGSKNAQWKGNKVQYSGLHRLR